MATVWHLHSYRMGPQRQPYDPSMATVRSLQELPFSLSTATVWYLHGNLTIPPRLPYGPSMATVWSLHGYRMVPPRYNMVPPWLTNGPSTATIWSFNSYPQWLHGCNSNNNNKDHLAKGRNIFGKKKVWLFSDQYTQKSQINNTHH